MLARSMGILVLWLGLASWAAAQSPIPSISSIPVGDVQTCDRIATLGPPISAEDRPQDRSGHLSGPPVRLLVGVGRTVALGRPEPLADATRDDVGADAMSIKPIQLQEKDTPPLPTPRPIQDPGAVPPPKPLPPAAAERPPRVPISEVPFAPSAADLGLGPADGWGGQACEPEGVTPRVAVQFDWLYWASTGQRLPPLVTAAPIGTTAAAGAYGNPGTRVLAGVGVANGDVRNGFRFAGTRWLDNEWTVGLRADFLVLGTSNQPFAAGPTASDILARPLVNGQTGLPGASMIARPGVVVGTVRTDARNDVIGGGLGEVFNLRQGDIFRVDGTIGYRYLNVRDQVTVNEQATALSALTGWPPGTATAASDRFRTSNHFHGGAVGLDAEWRGRRWFVGVKPSVAVGVSRQVVDIAGERTVVPPGGAFQAFPGGLLTQPSNIGHYVHDGFAVLPEIGLKAGYWLTEQCRVSVGYNVLYLSRVARVGGQIDPRVNPGLSAGGNGLGPAFPAYAPATTDFWLHGVDVKIEWRF